jgi:hypothetical protein
MNGSDLCDGLRVKFDERVLDDVARTIVVAEQVDDIAQQWPLVQADGLADKDIVIIVRRAHAGLGLKDGSREISYPRKRASSRFLRGNLEVSHAPRVQCD